MCLHFAWKKDKIFVCCCFSWCWYFWQLFFNKKVTQTSKKVPQPQPIMKFSTSLKVDAYNLTKKPASELLRLAWILQTFATYLYSGPGFQWRLSLYPRITFVAVSSVTGNWTLNKYSQVLNINQLEFQTFLNVQFWMEKKQMEWMSPFLQYSSILHLQNSVFNKHWEYFKYLKALFWQDPSKYTPIPSQRLWNGPFLLREYNLIN